MEGEKPIEQNIQTVSDDKKSGIEFRTHKSSERGTEMQYATIPLKIVDSQDFFQEVESLLDGFYDLQGEGNLVDENDCRRYKENIGYYVNDIRNFVKSTEKEDWFNLGPRKKDPDRRDDEQTQYMFSMKKGATKLIIMQQPVVHGMFSGNFGVKTPYEGLQSILNKGFISSRSADGNTLRKKDKDYRFTGYDIKMEGEIGDIKNGDSYAVELFPEEGNRAGLEYTVRKASTDRISSVNICLNELASSEEKEEKMAFYKKEIFEKYKIPVRFFVLVGDEKDENKMVRIFPKSK